MMINNIPGRMMINNSLGRTMMMINNSLGRKKQVVEPNFLVIGAQKCATSWLARNIKQHPDTFTPFKLEKNSERLR